METYYLLIVEEYSVRRDSCGAGESRSGCGIKKIYRFLADGSITYQDDRAYTYPYGMAGGKPGASSRKTLIRASGEQVDLPSKVSDVPVYEGDHLIFETAGAGGVGDPLSRDPEAVAKDVRWRLISSEVAATEYGVVLGEDGAVDPGATEARRGELCEGRGETNSSTTARSRRSQTNARQSPRRSASSTSGSPARWGRTGAANGNG